MTIPGENWMTLDTRGGLGPEPGGQGFQEPRLPTLGLGEDGRERGRDPGQPEPRAIPRHLFEPGGPHRRPPTVSYTARARRSTSGASQARVGSRSGSEGAGVTGRGT